MRRVVVKAAEYVPRVNVALVRGTRPAILGRDGWRGHKMGLLGGGGSEKVGVEKGRACYYAAVKLQL